MPTEVNSNSSSAAASADPPGDIRFLARQPILDLAGRVHGYELLFRNGPDALFQGDGNQATLLMLDNTVMFGLGKLTSGLPAFLNCTAEALTGELVYVLPRSMTVLEILENVEPTPALISACRKLKASGFRLALDDFSWNPKFAPLVEIADYIKVDFQLSGVEERRELLDRLQPVNLVFLAEKIETQAEFEQARSEGFTLFQGYYFCRPILLKNRNVPANRLSHIQILQLMQKESIGMRELSHAVKTDAALTYRILRLVNSPMCAVRREVRSIQAALIAVGEDIFRRVATLAITTELNSGRPMEILRVAFVRARFCELAAELCALNPTEQYLLGLLSLLPAMLSVPMDEITQWLPLNISISEALHGKPNSKRVLLQWIENNERGDWAACEAIFKSTSLPEDRVLDCYQQAVEWAEDALNLAV